MNRFLSGYHDFLWTVKVFYPDRSVGLKEVARVRAGLRNRLTDNLTPGTLAKASAFLRYSTHEIKTLVQLHKYRILRRSNPK